MIVSSGKDSPLGIHLQGTAACFSLFSEKAAKVTLGLFEINGGLIQEIEMERTGPIWHIAIDPFPANATYAFRIEGPKEAGTCFHPDLWLADPYATCIESPFDWRTKPEEGRAPRSYIAPRQRPFDWQGVKPPLIPKEDLIIYEMHVRGFTKHPSSHTLSPGSYRGVIEKIPYLKKLGINAVEILPLFEFDETHTKTEGFCNYWGYNPLHFFTPMRRYDDTKRPFGAIDSLKEMVRELHRNGIETILDVVYNHTGEGKELDYTINFRGIDQFSYYLLDQKGHLKDYTGCGNVLNANRPAVRNMILDSLRFWSEEFHIDGFRFDLASTFLRGNQGEILADAPILQAIRKDPILSKKKLIAEAWDAAGLYQVGVFPHLGPWSEWNGLYRDRLRRFLKGTDGETSHFADALCGSESIYKASQTPLSSVNFITSHDGFTLRDLVTYQKKHNLANGENNQDGTDENNNWNCGQEGPTNNPDIQALRERQMRNFLLALFLSQGIPMLRMGDEYGHSAKGNNNPYVQDNELNWFLWDEEESPMRNFVAELIAFRKKHPVLRRNRFLTNQDIQWHGFSPNHPDFGFHSRFIAFTLVGKTPIYAAFNAHFQKAAIRLPEDHMWRSIVETEKDWKDQTFKNPAPLPATIDLPPYSALLAIGPI